MPSRFQSIAGRFPAFFRSRPRLMLLVVSFLFLLLYGLTAQRGVSWQDSGEFQYRVVVGDYTWNSGIARAHPGYLLLARGFAWLVSPLFGPVFATTLFSSVGMALALALLGILLLRLTRDPRPALAAALALGFAHMAWWMGTMAEVYSWSLAFLFAELLALSFALGEEGEGGRCSRFLSWPAVFLLAGLHFTFHNFALLDLAVYGVFFVLRERRERRFVPLALAIIASFLVGSAPVSVLAIAKLREGASLPAVVSSVLFGEGYARLVLGTDGIPWRRTFANLGLAALSLLTPVWLFAFGGLRRGLRRNVPFRRLLLVLTVVHVLFWIRYFVPDQATFVLPTLGLLALWAGLGISGSGLPARRLALLVLVGLGLQLLVPLFLAEALHAPAAQRAVRKAHRPLPYRDEVDYWILPWKSEERSAELFAKSVDSLLDEGGIVYADSTAAPPLMIAFYQAQDLPPWDLYTPWNSDKTDFVALGRLYAKGGPPLFVVTPRIGYAPYELLASRQYGFLRQGPLYWAVQDLEKRGAKP